MVRAAAVRWYGLQRGDILKKLLKFELTEKRKQDTPNQRIGSLVFG